MQGINGKGNKKCSVCAELKFRIGNITFSGLSSAILLILADNAFMISHPTATGLSLFRDGILQKENMKRKA